MPDLLPVTLDEMIQEVQRELAMRARLYPEWKSKAGRNKRNQMDRQFDVMEAILKIWRNSSVATWQSDTKRSDGLYVHKLGADSWAIRFNGASVTECPCCGKGLVSQRVARLVADRVYPPQPEAA